MNAIHINLSELRIKERKNLIEPLLGKRLQLQSIGEEDLWSGQENLEGAHGYITSGSLPGEYLFVTEDPVEIKFSNQSKNETDFLLIDYWVTLS